MTLNASAENGASTAGGRVASSALFGSTPCTGGMSTGLGR